MFESLFSVIIPVYNAEKFLVKSVESALNIPGVGEVILIEDKSPDNALAVCKDLKRKYQRVKLLTHPDRKNRGAGASRNLGVKNAEFEFIAFLDADDWYLPNRFDKDLAVIKRHPEVDAVFSYPVMEKDSNNFKEQTDPRSIVGNTAKPKEFYKFFLKNKYPFFHANAVTFRKSFLLEEKMFDERLRLHQDSELWLRTLRRGNFYAGELFKPVAVIRKHEGNRITSRTSQSRLLMLAVFIQNVKISSLYNFEKAGLFKNILRSKSKKFSSNYRRRLYYYSNLSFFWFRKDQFFEKFVDETLG